MRFLIVESTGQGRHEIQKGLGSLASQVMTDSNGHSARILLKEDRFDVIIVGTWIQPMPCLDFIREVRTKTSSRSAIIIVAGHVTAMRSMQAVLTRRRKGAKRFADGYIVVPFKEQVLRERIKEIQTRVEKK